MVFQFGKYIPPFSKEAGKNLSPRGVKDFDGNEGWMHIQLSAGKKDGVPIARTDGITLFAPSEQLKIFQGLKLHYYGDLSGGGFLISTPDYAEGCACGAGFRFLASVAQEKK